METINHECYVSLEVAKLLKKAGFDWECRCYYPGNFLKSQYEGYPKPTLDIAQKWLREVKNIDVVVSRAMQWKQLYYTITHEENRTSKIDFMSLNEDLWWFKYEEALEAGIQKALELILDK